MDEQEVLAQLRVDSLTDLSNVSEAELHEHHTNVKSVWDDIQELKRTIALRKKEAAKSVDDQYADQLNALLADYSLMIKLIR